MKIKFKTGISGPNYSYSKGDEADFDKKKAIRLCEAGIARPIKEEDVETSAKDYPYHKGGGYYKLSNGDTVQGKKKAVKAEKELG